jgi:ADP-heptose:LPS heptosyltransferase
MDSRDGRDWELPDAPALLFALASLSLAPTKLLKMQASPKRKILVIELWGVGDLTFTTPFLVEAIKAGHEVHVLGKEFARALLQPSFPEIRFIAVDMPWCRYRGKYRLWEWDWPRLASLLWQLRRERYDAVVSVRNDPRDHFLMGLIGSKARYGFPMQGSQIFLTHPVARSLGWKQHKVEDWRDLGTAMEFNAMETAQPWLSMGAYSTPKTEGFLPGRSKPVICLHAGARIAVRRWPEPYFEKIIHHLREEFDFQLLLIPDPDGYGTSLAPLADWVLPELTLPELCDVLSRVDLLFCNDSGPGHIAAAFRRPTIPIFGPSEPDWFRPWGTQHKVIIRDFCPWRPCFDYCTFPEPYCMTKLLPARVWPEIREHLLHLLETGLLPQSLLKPASPISA